MPSRAPDDVASFFAGYPPAVAATAAALRTLIVATLPKVEETLDLPGRLVGYGYGPGYKGTVCTIIPSKAGVKLGLVNGASLPDPERLLSGTGKVHRVVALAAPVDAGRPGVRRLLAAALAAWHELNPSWGANAKSHGV